MEHRLAAILAADMASYTKHVERDTLGTVASWRSIREAVIDPQIAEFGGRIVKHTGDGFLAEFKTVQEAVECALSVQEMLSSESLAFRIGVHLGDVIDDGEDIHGEGVNIAARIEALAEPGGISISAGVYEQIRNRIDSPFIDTGEHSVKHVSAPIRIWRWSPSELNVGALSQNVEASKSKVILELPNKPSVAILPFDNMSNVSDEDYLGEGIAEDIITALSKMRSLFVIARNSSFSFKGKAVDVKEIGKRLGVRYVVEGSVRRSGDRVRITAQLVDATEDKHIWAERYDRDLEDIFAVQDEVTLAIVQAIQPQLVIAEQVRALRKPPESLDAWENYQRGMWHLLRYSPEECETAISFLSRAIELDSGFAAAAGGLGYGHCVRILHGISEAPDVDIEKALSFGRIAAKLDDGEPYAYLTIGRANIFRRHYEEALSASKRAIELNPNFALGHMIYGHALWHSGNPQDAVPALDVAIRVSPHDPLIWVFLASKAIALMMLERHDEAISVSKAAQENPNAAIYAYLGELSARGHKDDEDATQNALKRALAVMPDLSIGYVDTALPVADGHYRELFVGGLRRAGVSD